MPENGESASTVISAPNRAPPVSGGPRTVASGPRSSRKVSRLSPVGAERRPMGRLLRPIDRSWPTLVTRPLVERDSVLSDPANGADGSDRRGAVGERRVPVASSPGCEVEQVPHRVEQVEAPLVDAM